MVTIDVVDPSMPVLSCQIAHVLRGLYLGAPFRQIEKKKIVFWYNLYVIYLL